MDDYLNEIISNLTIEDINLLGILQAEDASTKQKSIRLQSVFAKCETTEAKFRKLIDKLSALKFVTINKDYKEHRLFISDYGVIALNNILQTMEG